MIKRFLLTRHYLVLFIVSLTESMATTPEEDAIIRRRFLTQVSVSKGQPPLKDLVRKYLQFCQEVEAGHSIKAIELRDSLLTSLLTTQASSQRQSATVDANLREQEAYAARRTALEADIVQTNQDIAARRKQLAAARIQKQRNEEYEALRRSIMKFPKRATSLASTKAVQAESEAIEAEGIAIGRLVDRRRNQMLAVLNSVDSLAASIDADSSNGPVPMEV